MSMNRVLVYGHSKVMYHFILFVAFILAVVAIPFVQNLLTEWIAKDWLVVALSYLAAYLFAIYVFPEMGFWLYKSSMKRE